MPEEVTDKNWKISTRCETSACVEVALDGEHGEAHVRDTKNRSAGVLTFSREAWTEFTDALRNGNIAR